MKNPEPTMDDYRQIGAELADLHDTIVHLSTRIGQTIGKKYGFPQLQWVVGKTRSDLEEKMCKEYPDEFSVDIFYPYRKEKVEDVKSRSGEHGE